MEKDGTTLVMPDITKGCMGKQKRLVIRGRELSIERYTKGDCKVCGVVEEFSFE